MYPDALLSHNCFICNIIICERFQQKVMRPKHDYTETQIQLLHISLIYSNNLKHSQNDITIITIQSTLFHIAY